MSFINEFPHTDFYGSDLRELIAMYKKLLEDYESIKTMVEEAVQDYNSLISDNTEIKARMNRIESKMDTLQKQITSAVNTQLNAFSKEINKSVDNKIADLNTSIINLVNRVNSEITELTNYVTKQITTIRKDVSKVYSQNKYYTDSKIAKLEQYVNTEDDRIKKLISDIKIDQTELISPIDGILKPTQEVIDELYYNLRNWVLRAMDYDNLKLTADEYDELHVTAWNYDNLGKWYIREKPSVLEQAKLALKGIDNKITEVTNEVTNEFVRRTTGYSPFSGMVKNVVELFYEMAGYLRQNAIESAEYDAMELTADEYDSKDLTAYIYDWYARLVFISGVSEITAQRYDNLLLNAYQYDAFRLTALDYDMYAGALLIGA